MEEEILPEKENFERINYSLRPAKHIERKMFCETFGKLSILDNLKNYRYIGMGSAYFSDFSLFHKTLGINKLLSIEGTTSIEARKRIKFNKPFACIDIEFGWTDKVLPQLPWSKWKEKSIVWLDYIDKMKEWMFSDIDTVLFNIRPGSVFLISVNIEEDDERDKKANPKGLGSKDFRFKMLTENVGRESIPKRANDLSLNIEDNKSIIREIIDNAFRRAIKNRNGGVSEDDQVEYKQIFNLHYRDSADMLTVGGIIFTKNQEDKVGEMFEHLDFIREGDDCFSIVVPKLTYREIHALDKVLPPINGRGAKASESDLNKIPLSAIDKKNYASIYRYFPTFAETNL
jgi:hypothetical protein